MKGKSNSELASIDVELKEAVCDAIVNSLVDRVSGADERGRNLLGSSPRRGIFAGQLLPRFDTSGNDDETTDIRIAALGVDLLAVAGAASAVRVTPRFSVYVRVIPTWSDLVAGGGELEFDFRLRTNIQQQIDDASSQRPSYVPANWRRHCARSSGQDGRRWDAPRRNADANWTRRRAAGPE